MPFLKKLHEQCLEGVENPDLPTSPEQYAKKRSQYRKTGEREELEGEVAPEGPED